LRDFRGGGDGGDKPEVLLGRWPGQALLLSAISNQSATVISIDSTASHGSSSISLAIPSIFSVLSPTATYPAVLFWLRVRSEGFSAVAHFAFTLRPGTH
jgi:hypothetical protein